MRIDSRFKSGTLIKVTQDLNYDPPFYLYPRDRGHIKIPAGTLLTVTHRKASRQTASEHVFVWVVFASERLLVPTDSFEEVRETCEAGRDRFCLELKTEAEQSVAAKEKVLANAQQRLAAAHKINDALSQIKMGDFALISTFAYDFVARVDGFALGSIQLSVLASESRCSDAISLTPAEVFKLELFPKTDLPLLLVWHYKTKYLEHVLKGRPQ